MQILPNIYLADGFAYAQHPKFYVIHNEEGTIVVDAGTVQADLERAERQLGVWGISLEKMDYLFFHTQSSRPYRQCGCAAGARSVCGCWSG